MLIQTNNGTDVGKLLLKNYYQPSWAPSKSDIFMVYYNLKLQGEQKTQNRYFTDKYALSSNGKYMAIQEFVVTTKEQELDNQDTQLVIIDLRHQTQSIISRIENGYVTPMEFTTNTVLYTKHKVGQSSMQSHFELTLADIQNWESLYQ